MPTNMGIRIGAGGLATILIAGAAIGCSSKPLAGGDAGDAAATTDGATDGGSCAPLVITDPAASLDGYTRFSPAEKQNNPNAQDPSYVFLAAGSEAVVLSGPDVPARREPLSLNAPAISLVGAISTFAEGYLVAVN